MSRKSLAVLAALALASGIASADTPIVLTFDGVNQWSGSFTALATGANTFSLDLSSLAGSWTGIDLVSVVTAGFAGPNGYDVTSVTFDGITYTAEANINIAGFGVDAWTYHNGVTAGMHTLVVTGNLIGGATGFDGKINITAQPVPEPESYALMLAGLAAIGAIARRRSSR